MPINLKNYTTEVPASRSIDMIEKLLQEFGATHVSKEFEGGKVKLIQFRVIIENTPFAFQLPAKPAAVEAWLKKKSPKISPKIRAERAERIAWKVQYEYLFIQLSLITLDQLEPLQALLPFLYDYTEQKSFYEKLKDNKFTNLLPSSK